MEEQTMKQQIKYSRLAFMTLVFLVCWVSLCYGRPTAGQPAPSFILQDVAGTSYNLSQMADNKFIILYFFDAGSRPSQEGLLNLDQLRKQHKDAGLTVWGITLSSKDLTEKFLNLTNLDFPVLLDTKKISDAYNARLVLPTVCIVGPGLKVLDYFQGGGKTTEIMQAVKNQS
jgi:peroxiredoxin